MDMNTTIFSNYPEEIERHWKFRESQRPTFGFSSPQLGLRRELIDWLLNISEKLSVSCRTFHLAIYILDFFMDRHSITVERLGFVALVCLMLAVKFEEIDAKVPKISEMNKFDGLRYSNKDFIRVEIMVLKCLKFELTQPTVAHFAEYYALVTVLPQDQKMSQHCLQRLGEIARKVIGEFLDICLKEVKFLMIRPSQAAAACMFATRYLMNLSPAWTHILSTVTGYEEEDIISSFKLLMLGLHQKEAKRNQCAPSPDSGYVSETPTPKRHRGHDS